MKSIAKPHGRWRRAVVATSVLSGMLFTGVMIAPLAVMNSSYRDSVLNSRLQPFGLTAKSASGSGSWMTPFEFRDVVMTDATGRVQLTVDAIRTSKPLTGLLFNGGHLGTFTIVKPALSVEADDDGNIPLLMPDLSDTSHIPDLAFTIEDSAFKLIAPWRTLPVIDLTSLNITGNIATAEGGRWLTVDPVQVFDREQLSEAHTQQNLALIAPVLAQTTALHGEVSVRMNETRIRLQGENGPPVTATGEAIFHSVHAKLRQEWIAQVGQLVGKATGQPVNTRLQITRDSRTQFELDEHGVSHRGLTFLLPDVADRMQIESSGVVGLDEHLDLTFAVQFPQATSSGPLMSLISQMVSAPLKLYVRGTVSEPRLIAPGGFSVVDQLSKNVAPAKHTTAPPALTSAVMDVIGSAASPPAPGQSENITGGILNIIRAAKEAKAHSPAKVGDSQSTRATARGFRKTQSRQADAEESELDEPQAKKQRRRKRI